MPVRATATRSARADLIERLAGRRSEIEAAVMVRITALAASPERGEPEYGEGLRAAVTSAVGYALEGLAKGEDRSALIPDPLLAQARRAVRSGVGLDTVLRRYVAGHALVGDFLVQEAERLVAPAELKRLLRCLAAILDCLLAAVTAAYGLEERRHWRTTEQRRRELVERLLAGEPLDASELGYELEGHHLGFVTSGPGAGKAVRDIASDLDRPSLLVSFEDERRWVWIGGWREFDGDEIQRICSFPAPNGLRLVLGEPGEGLVGWRMTHQQATAALTVAACSQESVVRYREVALLASVAQDELLAASLRLLYLVPLEAERDGGVRLRETLRAYFTARGNLTSAAADLGVSRKTVNTRLRTAEERLGSSLGECAGPLELAIQMVQNLKSPHR